MLRERLRMTSKSGTRGAAEFDALVTFERLLWYFIEETQGKMWNIFVYTINKCFLFTTGYCLFVLQ